MTRTELLKKLLEEYPFSKSTAMVQIATEEGKYEDDDLIITVTKESGNVCGRYDCRFEWKDGNKMVNNMVACVETAKKLGMTANDLLIEAGRKEEDGESKYQELICFSSDQLRKAAKMM